jgi:hypothetical protein
MPRVGRSLGQPRGDRAGASVAEEYFVVRTKDLATRQRCPGIGARKATPDGQSPESVTRVLGARLCKNVYGVNKALCQIREFTNDIPDVESLLKMLR